MVPRASQGGSRRGPPPSPRAALQRWEQTSHADWLVPALCAVIWGTALAGLDAHAIGTQRTLVAVGGPTVLLSGLHARLYSYLHAPWRGDRLVQPIPPDEHFIIASRTHRAGWLRSAALGTLAIVLSVASRLDGDPIALGLVADWLVFALIAWATEPFIAAASAWAGRRFPSPSTVRQLQDALGGGWTLREAVVHLYGPALGLGLAMVLALPAQLAIDQAVDGMPAHRGLFGAAVLGVAIAMGLRWLAAPRLYRLGVFEAVPFLAEATKTLAGPAIPDPPPRWLRWLRDPSLRLVVLQFYRLTPVPNVRLIVLAVGTVLAARNPSAPLLVILAATALVWLVPAQALVRSRPVRARLLAPLPTDGSPQVAALALLFAPPLLAFGTVFIRWSAL